MLDDAVLDGVAIQYDLGRWRSVRPLPGGCRVATEAGDFRVTVSPADRSEASLRFEAMLLAHLDDRAFPAPRLVRTRAGRPWHRSATGGTALVTEWVEGGVVDASLTQHRRRSVRALAEYHAAVRSFPPRLRAHGGPTVRTLEQEGPAALEAFSGTAGWHLDADGRRRLRSTTSYLWRQFIRVPELSHAGGVTLPRLVIHGGFGPAAVLLDGVPGLGRSGMTAVDGLSGFDRCRYDLRALDLAEALKTFARGAAGGFDLDGCADVMAAYDEVERLPAAEVAALPAVLRTGWLVRVFRLITSAGDAHDVAQAIEGEAECLRWLEEHEPAFVEALASSCVG